MKHLTEEQIVLHCFGDTGNGAETSRHLRECPECREQFEQLRAVLAILQPTPVPVPHEHFEQEMWLKMRDRLPQKRPTLPQRRFSIHFSLGGWAVAAAMAVLVLGALIAVRGVWTPGTGVSNSGGPPVQADAQQVALAAVEDHLERSQMLLVEIMNTDAKGGLDLSREQAQARELLDASRLYRLSVQEKSGPGVGPTLDQLERVLAEIANAPTDFDQGDLREIQDQVRSQSLLFKVRVVESQVRQEETSNQYSGNQRL